MEEWCHPHRIIEENLHMVIHSECNPAFFRTFERPFSRFWNSSATSQRTYNKAPPPPIKDVIGSFVFHSAASSTHEVESYVPRILIGLSNIYRAREASRQTDRQTDWQSDRVTDLQTDRLTDLQTYRPTDWLTDRRSHNNQPTQKNERKVSSFSLPFLSLFILRCHLFRITEKAQIYYYLSVGKSTS